MQRHRDISAPRRLLVTPSEPLAAREAYAFLAKFLFELHLHAKPSISPVMAQFCFRKALKLAHGKMRLRI